MLQTTIGGRPVIDHVVDALVIGSGGAGLRAAITLTDAGLNTACVGKVYPTRSHTVSAQGGINAALGNMGDGDDWRFHFQDTVVGGDWLVDQDAAHFMCREAANVVTELERFGLPFSRTPSGKIYQRSFGGQTLGGKHKGLAKRTACCADRTGHAMIHTMFGQALKKRCKFFQEFFALDLLMDAENKSCQGALFMSIVDGSFHRFRAARTIIATGGAGRVYETSTAGHPCTGDGAGLVLRAGLPLEDMEMIQFHPTGIHKVGCLISEAVRGEGGFLTNSLGERFMERYAQKAKDLASRDVVSRAMAMEMAAGRGCGPNKDYINLELRHLPRQLIEEQLPGISETARLFTGVDVTKDPIPVAPTVHYTMGGIPTTVHGEVRTLSKDGKEVVVPGLFAAGEAACVSVHGANRLGANSLLDIIVFGKAAAEAAVKDLKPNTVQAPLKKHEGHETMAKILEMVNGATSKKKKGSKLAGDVSVAMLRGAMQKTMQDHASVFRTAEIMSKGVTKMDDLWDNARKQVKLSDSATSMNTELIEALELENMMMQSKVILKSALGRQESRGAHAREDFPKRDDTNWLKHTLGWLDKETGKVSIDYRPVHLYTLDADELKPIQPKERSY